MDRISIVNGIKLDNLGFASAVLIGDNVFTQTRTHAFAVQRELAIFEGSADPLSRYPIFSQPFSRIVIDERLNMKVTNESPYIKVNTINVIAISTASVMHIGSNCVIDTQKRVIDFRQFYSRETYEAALARERENPPKPSDS